LTSSPSSCPTLTRILAVLFLERIFESHRIPLGDTLKME